MIGFITTQEQAEAANAAIAKAQTDRGKRDLHEDIGGEFTYDGLIDSTGIWATQLNEAQVAALYNNGNGLPYDQF